MALDADLQSFHAEEVSSVSTNGGRISDNLITSGVVNNVWPNVLKAERTAGSRLARKIFDKLNDDSNDPLSAAQFLMDIPTAGEDWVVMSIGTATDTEASLSASARKYGVAYLTTDVAAGAGSCVVTVPDASLTTGNDQIFFDTDTIRLTTKPNPASATGLTEDIVIDGAPSVSGTDITITFATNTVNAYTVADGGRVSSVYDHASDIVASVDSPTVTSSAGTFDNSSYPIVGHNQATIDTVITLTFTDANNFTAASPQITGLASGNITTDYEPSNATWTNPYITIEFEAWGGTWAAGDTLVITTHSATVARWEERIVPAACASLANNKAVSAWNGESAA